MKLTCLKDEPPLTHLPQDWQPKSKTYVKQLKYCEGSRLFCEPLTFSSGITRTTARTHDAKLSSLCNIQQWYCNVGSINIQSESKGEKLTNARKVTNTFLKIYLLLKLPSPCLSFFTTLFCKSKLKGYITIHCP